MGSKGMMLAPITAPEEDALFIDIFWQKSNHILPLIGHGCFSRQDYIGSLGYFKSVLMTALDYPRTYLLGMAILKLNRAASKELIIIIIVIYYNIIIIIQETKVKRIYKFWWWRRFERRPNNPIKWIIKKRFLKMSCFFVTTRYLNIRKMKYLFAYSNRSIYGQWKPATRTFEFCPGVISADWRRLGTLMPAS